MTLDMQPLFLAIFFGISLWLSISPSKACQSYWQCFDTCIITCNFAIDYQIFVTPIGAYAVPQPTYATNGTAVLQGFLDGYNTMDALASVVFAILVIDFVRLTGATSRDVITKTVMEVGAIAVALLGIVYIFIANIGATSVERFGLFDTGAPVLTASADFLFGELVKLFWLSSFY